MESFTRFKSSPWLYKGPNLKVLWSKFPIITHTHTFPGARCVFHSEIAQEWVNVMIATDGRCSVTSQLLKANKHDCEMELIECDRQQQCLLGRHWFSLQSLVNSKRRVTENIMLWMRPLGDYITILFPVTDMPLIKIINTPVLTHTHTGKYTLPGVRQLVSLMLYVQISWLIHYPQSCLVRCIAVSFTYKPVQPEFDTA